MTPHKLAAIGLSAATAFLLPSCNKSSETNKSAEEVKESVGDANNKAVESAEKTADALTKTAQDAKAEVLQKVDEIKESPSGSVAQGSKARELMNASYAATEQYAELMESIKDQASAKAALAKFDDLGKKYEEIATMAKSIAPDATAPEETMALQKEMMEKMEPLQKRLQSSVATAMQVLAADPDLMKEFQEKSMALATKMAGMAGAQ